MGGRKFVTQEKLRQVKEFLEPFKYLANAHMTSFITDNYWETLPEDIKTEATALTVDDMYATFWSWGRDPANFNQSTAIGEFFRDCWALSLGSELFDDLLLSHDTCNETLQTKRMSVKKNHEISNLKEKVAIICNASKSNCVVDVGGGKGYLGTSLVLEKQIHVLSVDSKSHNTKGAVEMFERATKQAEASRSGSSLYKHATAFVTPETNLLEIVNDKLCSKIDHKICLTGLHVCGDLTSTCIKLFLKCHEIVSLCTIGCCYNLITETYGLNFPSDEKHTGFPLSNFLFKDCYALGRNARMIACQSIDRICHERKEMNPSLFWRAALQVHLLRQLGPNCEISVGRHCSKATSFLDYFQKVQQYLDQDLEEKIQELDFETRGNHDRMIKFYCLRLALAPVIETLILLDRLLYLHEEGIENAYIMKVFDGVKSPRCYAIIGVKMEGTISQLFQL
ncbi:Methyltransferase-like protein 25 [Frankliniella fusca]|uniref:Methyltransferase-like protein 25 n=1 Tax=Frankliniella fusca TaxID=407009 RepID=A0AAE1I0Y5_9NEOP|nr:Methyltransferase-like protein 25 [Frankliniella fusca]